MIKHFLFILAFLSLVSCGQKSIIKADVKSLTTAEAYGDGKFVIRPLYMPLSDQAISVFNSPVEKVDFIAGGLARMFMNLGASMGMGRAQLTLTQPIPEIPTDVIKGTKLKRLFFYIQPKKGKERWSSMVRRVLFGQGNITFDFLDKMAIKLTPIRQDKFESWYPTFDYTSLKKRDFAPLQVLFENEQPFDENVNVAEEQSLVILKYDQQHKERYIKNDTNGVMYIVHTKKPAETKRYLTKHPKFRGFFKQIQMLNETLVVELKKDPVIEESLKVTISEEADLLEEFKIDLIEECTENTCLDLKVPDVDLLPLITKGNAIKVDAYINANKAPDSFQLEGFMEFEMKLQLSF